jgi:hypothetical protein
MNLKILMLVDDTDAKDENNILFETPTSIYESKRERGQN